MAIFTTENEIQTLREAGHRLAFVLERLAGAVFPGASETALDMEARRLIAEEGDTPSFLNYTPRGARRPYPAALCVSVNDEVVHGIPSERKFAVGDIVTLDLGLARGGVFVDAAVTVGCGSLDETGKRLIETTRGALYAGIAVVRAGVRTGDVGNAVETHVRKGGFLIIPELGGHGLGRSPHDGPFIPNYGKRGTGKELVAGMVLAVEPIVGEGSPEIYSSPDGYTLKTKDGKRSAQFEHTILVT
ncbi:MAG: type I methionyl aminopeptidase, partial [Parcubacteria group bacterium]|nr:type I methionyl aminopeptidase [Parcubacteria group bacterium]